MSHEPGSNHAHPVPLKALFGVWAALIVLTVLTVTVTRLPLGNFGIVAAMGIATLKSVLVALIFMHLLWDRAVNSLVFASSVLFVFLFISFSLLDTSQYRSDLIPGYAPAITGTQEAAGGGAAEPALTGIERGQSLYTTICVVCHGANAEGKKDLHAPALHYQSAWYLASQLTNMRSGLRGTQPDNIPGSQMRPMALALPDDQATRDVAEYIASLDAPPPPFTFEADVAAGAAFYNTVCVTCHGPDGQGVETLQSPAIAGQHDWYLLSQLEAFRNNTRGYDPSDTFGLQMRAMSLTIPSDEMVRNVAAHVAQMGRQDASDASDTSGDGP